MEKEVTLTLEELHEIKEVLAIVSNHLAFVDSSNYILHNQAEGYFLSSPVALRVKEAMRTLTDAQRR